MAREKFETFTNEVYAEDDTVVKIYKEEKGLSRADALTRLRREVAALLYYRQKYPNSIFTPSLISVDVSKKKVVQQRIRGKSFQEMASLGGPVQFLAGELLKKIHVPLNRPVSYLEEDFDQTVARVKNYPHMKELLELGGISVVDLNVDLDEVYSVGSMRTHGDYWLPHLIMSEEDNLPYVVDWDHARPGTPYRDYATFQMWALDRFGDAEEFWKGYGYRPNQPTIDVYVRLQCLRYLTHIDPDSYLQEPSEGFYHQQMSTLRNLS